MKCSSLSVGRGDTSLVAGGKVNNSLCAEFCSDEAFDVETLDDGALDDEEVEEAIEDSSRRLDSFFLCFFILIPDHIY